jgi:YVTN family beta-propeller protein
MPAALLILAVGCVTTVIGPRGCSLLNLRYRAQLGFHFALAISELGGLYGASFWNPGFPAFSWALQNRRAQFVRAFLFASFLRFQLLGFADHTPRVGFARGPGQQQPGVPVYFVGAPDNSVSVLNSETAAGLGIIPVGTDPRSLDFAPDGSFAYVTNLGSDSVSVIDTQSLRVTATIPLGPGSAPYGVAISPDRARAYVVNSGLNSVSVIDTALENVIATVPVGSGPSQVALSPDGLLAYVPNSQDNSVTVLDTFTQERVTTISNIPDATGVAFNHRGTRAYVTTATESTGQVHVINTDDHSVVTSIVVGQNPRNITLSPYGNVLLTADQSGGTITFIDTESNLRIDTVPVGPNPSAVAPIL